MLTDGSASRLNTTDLKCPLPDYNDLWEAKTAQDWALVFAKIHGDGHPTSDLVMKHRPSSFSSLSKQFLNKELAADDVTLPLMQLIALLFPLQTAVHHLRRFLDALADSIGASSTWDSFARTTDFRYLLRSWYELYKRTADSLKSDPHAKSFLVYSLQMYHFICLDWLLPFADIERLARGELEPHDSRWELLQTSCLAKRNYIWTHVGQAMRAAILMPLSRRSGSWPAAVYRVALIMWAMSVAGATRAADETGVPSDVAVPVDCLALSDGLLQDYAERNVGTPILASLKGRAITVESPVEVLSYCMRIFDEHPDPFPLFAGGARAKLESMRRRWYLS
ncbi:MAG: hypothetical protein M1828_003059 [Chrysothrix sp. TS-e1954]|nr:MAG: hypothetical protein M1828_003059 [Chrysothrix sp. TS-e1954]